MAGISLRLRDLLGSRSSAAQAAGFAYAGLAMAGPWLLTAVALWSLGAGAAAEDRRGFQAWVMYVCAVSSFLLSGLQLAAARRMSDRLYEGDVASTTPSFAAFSLLSLVLHSAAAILLAGLLRPPPATAAGVLALFQATGLLGAAMTYLGALRRHGLVLAAFTGGAAAAVLLGGTWFAGRGGAGALMALAAGELLAYGAVAARLRAEFPGPAGLDFGFLSTLREHPALGAAGVAVAAGLWADKIVHWFGPFSIALPSGLRSFPAYDHAWFLAYLATLPALALLFVRIEVSFSDRCAAFFEDLRAGADLPTLRRGQRRIVAAFRAGLWRILRFQAPFTLAAAAFAPVLADVLGATAVHAAIFRPACLAALLQVLVLAHVLAALHLGFYRWAALAAATHAAAAAALSAACFPLGWGGSALGVILADLLALAVFHAGTLARLRRIDRIVFRVAPARPTA